MFQRGTPANQRLRIFQRQRLAPSLFHRPLAAVETLVPLGNERGIRAILLDIFLNGLVEAGDQRGDQHNDADAQNHSKNGERAAHFVRAERVHRLLEVLGVRLRHIFSVCCASLPVSYSSFRLVMLRSDPVSPPASRDKSQRRRPPPSKQTPKPSPRLAPFSPGCLSSLPPAQPH